MDPRPTEVGRSRAVRRRASRRILAAVAAAAIVTAMVTGCRPEPAPVATPTESPTSSPTLTPRATPTPSPSETSPPDAGFELPAQCEDIYSADMLAALTAANPPLNDPGVTMSSTQNVDAVELLNSGIPTLRCSWGRPSEFGLATNVSVIDSARSAALLTALRSAGFGCESIWGGTLCRIEHKTIDLDDNEVTLGESHFLRGDGWVSTARVNFAPEGYDEDVVATLWG